ncbi:hypothetical protein Tco_1453267, partial [Tanacetum coccineum]
MKRQQSILSFLHKPSTEKPSSNPNPPRVNPSASDDVTGTDTPPEKEQRSFFLAGEAKGGSGGFNSIKHKFMRPNTTISIKHKFMRLTTSSVVVVQKASD